MGGRAQWMGLANAMIFLAAWATPVMAAANWRRARLRKQPTDGGGNSAGWEDMSCFMDLARFGLTATKDDVLFRSGHAAADGTPEVLVVQSKSKATTDASRRTLVFRSADGKCNEQAGTVCARDAGNLGGDGGAASALGADATLLSGDATATDKCASMICEADVRATLQEPGAGYVRSMVGAAAFLPSATGRKHEFLSVGLGAGTLALVLQQTFPGSHQTVVELSSDVAAAAPCFGAGSSNGLDISTGDGRAFLEESADGSFDAVFLDAFDASDKVPSCFTTVEFFKTAKRKLRAGGLLAMNAHTGKTLHDDVADLLPAARAVFGSGKQLQLGSAPGLANAILVAQVPDGAQTGASVLAQDANTDLAAWFQDALFQPAQASRGGKRAFVDADVQCTGR